MDDFDSDTDGDLVIDEDYEDDEGEIVWEYSILKNLWYSIYQPF